MGFLDFNITEIASRIVRGAAVRGRIRPTLDDGIIPAAIVMDYSQAPYRLDEQKYFACIPTSVAGGAGDSSIVCLLNKSRLPIVLEWWTSMTRGGAAQVIRMTMQTRAIVDTLAGISDTAFTSYENGPLPSTIRNDIVLRTANVVAGLFPVVGNFVDQFDLPAGGVLGVRPMSPQAFDLVIPPATALLWSPSVVNTQFSIAAQIRVVNNAAIQS